MTQSPLDVVLRYCDAMKIGVDACMAQMAGDVVFHSPCLSDPIPKILHGIDQVRPAYEMLFTKIFKEFHWASQEVLTTNDPEVIVAKMKSSAILMDGRSYSNDYMFYSRVKGGKIVEHWEFMDGGRAAEAFAGLL